MVDTKYYLCEKVSLCFFNAVSALIFRLRRWNICSLSLKFKTWILFVIHAPFYTSKQLAKRNDSGRLVQMLSILENYVWNVFDSHLCFSVGCIIKLWSCVIYRSYALTPARYNKLDNGCADARINLAQMRWKSLSICLSSIDILRMEFQLKMS